MRWLMVFVVVLTVFSASAAPPEKPQRRFCQRVALLPPPSLSKVEVVKGGTGDCPPSYEMCVTKDNAAALLRSVIMMALWIGDTLKQCEAGLGA